MDDHERLLAALLAGDLDQAATRRWDEHLLECEQCWRAVRDDRIGRQAAGLLREPAPDGLADRVAFAVELATASATAPHRPRRGVRWANGVRPHGLVGPGRGVRPRGRAGLGSGAPRGGRLAVAGALALALVVSLVVLLVPGGRASLPAPVAAVARYAQTVPPSAQHTGAQYKPGRAGPVQVGHSVTMTAGGHRIVLRTWRLGGTEVVVATSDRPFPMPPGARAASGGGMAWVARAGKLSLYCINGQVSELVAARVPAGELAALTARLPLT